MKPIVHHLYLLLGANLGDRKQTLVSVYQKVTNNVGVVTAQSALYETAAWGVTDQPAFLNQVLRVDTYLMPADVLAKTQAIEQQLGRVRAEKWGARTIDIDLLFYDDLILNTPTLTLPHPLLHKRRFTLIPLAELAPDLLHPILNMSVADLLTRCPDESEVIKFS